MIIHVPGAWQNSTVDSSQPLVFQSRSFRLRLTEHGLAVLEADREVQLWNASWNRIVRIRAIQGKANIIALESKEANFTVAKAQDFGVNSKYIEAVANAYLKAFQGEHNAQQEELEKYGKTDSRIRFFSWSLFLLYMVIFFFSLSGSDSGFNADSAAAGPLKHIIYGLVGGAFFLYCCLAFVMVPQRYFQEPRYSKAGILLQGVAIGLLPLLLSAICVGLGPAALGSRYTHQRGVPFEAVYPVVRGDLLHDKHGDYSRFLLNTGGTQSLRVFGRQGDIQRIKPGMTLRVSGLRSRYGLLVRGWELAGDPHRDMADIMKLLTENKADIVSAYTRATHLYSDMHGGTVRFRVTVAQDGSVQACSIVSSNLAEPGVETSIVDTVKRLNFGAVASPGVWEGEGVLNFGAGS